MGIWFATAQTLPCEDEAVQFVIGERSVPLRGQFRDGAFATRWWRYAADDVCNWCTLRPSIDVPGSVERTQHRATCLFADGLESESQP